MGGAWVFPGGAVDADEGEGDARTASRACARSRRRRRRAARPGGAGRVLALDHARRRSKIRFDTHFFLAAAPDGAEPKPDGGETVDLGWFTPRGRARGYERGEILLVFPTIKTLEQLARFGPPTSCSSGRAAARSCPIEPRVDGHGRGGAHRARR